MDKNPCEVNLDPQGFYNVQVQYTHCSAIAKGAGLSPSVVLETLDEDNIERQHNERVSLTDDEADNIGQDTDLEDEVDYVLSDEEIDSDPELMS